MKKYNLFLDDYRIPLDCLEYTGNIIYATYKWIVVKNYDEFVDTIEKNAKTAILYLNTCNGGTVIINNKKEKIIYSKENKLLLFDSNTLHRGFSQTDIERRIIININ